MRYFFESCTVTRTHPRASARLARYMKDRHGIDTAGCCRVGRTSLTPDDTAYAVCHTCSVILRESSGVGQVDFVWQIIDDDDRFEYPDLRGVELAVQDCWVTADRSDEHAAVRGILRKVGARVVELADSMERTKFCGTRLLAECAPRNRELAAGRLVHDAASVTRPMSEIEAAREMRSYCASLPSCRTLCYCAVCENGLAVGGHDHIHLIDLLFGE